MNTYFQMRKMLSVYADKSSHYILQFYGYIVNLIKQTEKDLETGTLDYMV